jgi:uncharacterized surface protein with fasciclin (FAS1) repeats
MLLVKIKSIIGVLAVLGLVSSTLLVNAETKNIVEVASGNSSFSTLVAAVKAAGLVDTLSGTGPFTVLAPTNEAFNKVPKEVLSKLLLPENKEALTKILTYHVIGSKADSAAVSKLTTVKTVEGSSIDIKVVDSKVMLNTKTTVVTPDVMASNGIIHAIDNVLIPASVDLTTLKGSASMSDNTTTVRTGGFNNVNITMMVVTILLLSYGAYKAWSASHE